MPLLDQSESNSGNGNQTIAQRWAELALKAGFQISVAAFLIWFITQKIDVKLDSISATQTRIMEVQAELKSQNSTSIEQMWQLISVGQATCLNVAVTQDARRACVTFDARRSR
jgi:hypothetical protein